MIRLMIIDDHPIVREGLVAVLEDQPDLQVVGSAGSVEEGIALAARLRPDVLLLDLEMPHSSGLEAIPRFLSAVNGLRILVFTAYDTDDHLFGALRSGAKGYLLKGASAEEITRAVQSVYGGGTYLEPRVATKVVGQIGSLSAFPTLTARELAVLRLVAEGRPNKQIAAALTITERTVKFHLTSIFQKLSADNRAQAVAIAVQRGLF